MNITCNIFEQIFSRLEKAGILSSKRRLLTTHDVIAQYIKVLCSICARKIVLPFSELTMIRMV